MAVYRPGPTVADIRGSIGGVTYARNRSGLFMRDRIKPIDRRTTGQMAARVRVTNLQAEWRNTLTSTMRTSWEGLASSVAGMNRLGDPIRLTAVNHFIQVNSIRLFCGLAYLTTAPAVPAGLDYPAYTLSGNTTIGLKLTDMVPVMTGLSCLLCRISPAYSATRDYYKGPWAITKFKLVDPALPWQLIGAGVPVIGQRFFVEFKLQNAVGRMTGYDRHVVDFPT